MRPHVIAWLSDVIGPGLARALAPGWFTFVGLAALVATWLAVHSERRRDPHTTATPTIITALFTGYVAALVCGIVFPMLWVLGEQLWYGAPLRLRWAGMTSFFGFAGGLAAMLAVVARSRRADAGALTPARFADAIAAPLGAALAVGRLGCFVAGCDYGKVSSVSWAVRFPGGSPAFNEHVAAGLVPASRGESLPVHPAQLYEAALGVALFAIAWRLGRSGWARRNEGGVLLVVVAIYAAARPIIELFRGDPGRGFFGPLSTGQLLCALALAGACAALWRRRAPVVAACAAALMVWPAARHAHADGAAAAQRSGPGVQAGVLVGASGPVNREEVPASAGVMFNGTFELTPGFGIGLDLELTGNEVAAHRTVLIAVATSGSPTPSWDIGARFGMGYTTVDFDDAAFDDQRAFGFRAALTADWAFSERWAMITRPFAIDFIRDADLGGPVWSFQFQIGIAFGFGGSRDARAEGALPVASAPAGPAPPEPAPPGRAPPEPAPPGSVPRGAPDCESVIRHVSALRVRAGGSDAVIAGERAELERCASSGMSEAMGRCALAARDLSELPRCETFEATAYDPSPLWRADCDRVAARLWTLTTGELSPATVEAMNAARTSWIADKVTECRQRRYTALDELCIERAASTGAARQCTGQ